MVSPGIDIRLFDATVYAPQISTAIMGMVGPATKGPVNELNEFTDAGNFVNFHGRPADRHYAPRAAGRYFRGGSQLKFVRIAGPNLATATLTLYAADGETPILIVTAATPGTWANGDIAVAISHNGTASYNLYVYFRGQQVEPFIVLTNGTIVTRVRNGSSRIRVALAPGAGAVFPAETTNAITGVLATLPLAGGDDGAFAKTESASSSTSGVAGKRFHGRMHSTAGTRTFATIANITAQQTGKTVYYGSLGMPALPGTVTIRVTTGAGTLELADDADASYGPGGAGVGLLAPAAGTHVGFIDYRTGRFGIKMTAGTVLGAAGQPITGIWVRANAESVGATAAGQAEYAGNLSSFPLAPGFYNANKLVITVPVSELVGTAAAGASNASSEATLKSLAGWIIPGTVVLTPGHATLAVPDPVYDDGFGGFRTGPYGTGTALTGTIDYRTGQWSVTWSGTAMPASGTVSAEYDIQLLNMGGNAVAADSGTFVAAEVAQASSAAVATATSALSGASPVLGPMLRGSLKVVISLSGGVPVTYYDNGLGGWLTLPRGDTRAVAVTGSIDYDTGAWSFTPTAGVDVTATVTFSYVSVAGEGLTRRALRGASRELIANTTTFLAGASLDAPSASNAAPFSGPSWVDHVTGEFAFKLALTTTGANTFDVADNGVLTAVYAPADILGFGDGTETVFTGELAPAPFRREAARLQAFQGAQASSAGAGETQVAYAALGASDAADYWTLNSALATDPDNTLNFRTGEASIQWTSAPLADEPVFVLAEEVVLHATARYPGDLGNERASLTSGFYIQVDEDPTLAGTLRLQVMFNGDAVESFGQATNLAELADAVNDAETGSAYVTVEIQAQGAFIPVDTGASQTCGLGGAFTQADVIGAKVGQVYTGLQMFANDEDVDVNWVATPGAWHRGVITALQVLCEKKGRRAMGVIPTPDLDDPFDLRDFVNGSYNAVTAGGVAVADILVPYPPLAAIDSRQLAIFGPWVDYFDTFAAAEVHEPPDGDIAELIASTPEPWQAIAGLKRGRIRASSITYSASREDRDLLYGPVGAVTEVVNSIIRKRGRGLVLYGQRTTQRHASATDRINVNWTVNVIMNALDNASQDFVFEINDPILWREIAQALNGVIKPIIEKRGLIDAQIVVDGTTTKAADIDALTVNAVLMIKPQGAAEYINYDLFLTPAGADFADVRAAG